MKVTLIGAGRMGRAHALAARELGLQIDAVCDIKEDAAERLGEEFGVMAARRSTDPKRVFEGGVSGLVIIATTADTHHSLTCAAASAGAEYILCEKPMATSIAQCSEMISVCGAHRTRLAINHQMRFMAQYNLVSDVIASGAIGRLGSMNVVAGNFGLAMNGSHYIEAFHFLTGTWPASVSGWFAGDSIPNPRGPKFFDQAGEFRFVGTAGQRLSLSIGSDQGHGMTVTYAGEYGHIFVDELEGEAIITSRIPEHRGQPTTRYGMPWARQTRRFPQADNVAPTKAVMAALLSGSGYPDGASGKKIVSSLAACYVSAETGHVPAVVESDGAVATRQFSWA